MTVEQVSVLYISSLSAIDGRAMLIGETCTPAKFLLALEPLGALYVNLILVTLLVRLSSWITATYM